MSRAPVFQCASGKAAQKFTAWLDEHIAEFVAASESTSHHLKYLSHLSWIRGRYVYVRFVFDTDEAMGMNMLSIPVQAAWEKMSSRVPADAHAELIALSSNVCCDKKDSAMNRILGRGYWAQAEVVLSRKVIESVLKTTP